MDIGMLWYDDDAKRKFDEKVARAAVPLLYAVWCR